MDDAGALQPERQRKFAFVESAPQLGIEEIHARGFDFNEDLTWSGRRQWHFLEPHCIGPVLVDSDRSQSQRPHSVKSTASGVALK